MMRVSLELADREEHGEIHRPKSKKRINSREIIGLLKSREKR